MYIYKLSQQVGIGIFTTTDRYFFSKIQVSGPIPKKIEKKISVCSKFSKSSKNFDF